MESVQNQSSPEPDGATDREETTPLTAQGAEQDAEKAEPHIWLSVN
ncbi:hypothetical protein QWJ26_08455 [Streptomyces sp. CSDS2]|nr:hypothetical protein [Streptomyces sp. CSDS2]MDN3259843.1 hypothetical protein [Streptomyces sp. CSDS2]